MRVYIEREQERERVIKTERGIRVSEFLFHERNVFRMSISFAVRCIT